jgi:hypothetical protein
MPKKALSRARRVAADQVSTPSVFLPPVFDLVEVKLYKLSLNIYKRKYQLVQYKIYDINIFIKYDYILYES